MDYFNLSDPMRSYLALESVLVRTDDEATAERVREAMDHLWHNRLSADEHGALNDRDTVARGMVTDGYPGENYREGAEGWAEWSIPMDEDEDHRPYRLFVRLDDLIEVFESVVTSKHPGARELGHAKRLTLSSAEAEWLLRVLPLALLRKNQQVDPVDQKEEP